MTQPKKTDKVATEVAAVAAGIDWKWWIKTIVVVVGVATGGAVGGYTLTPSVPPAACGKPCTCGKNCDCCGCCQQHDHEHK